MTFPYLTYPTPPCWNLILPCLNSPYHSSPYLAIPYHTIPYQTIPYTTIPYHTIPYHTIPHHKITHHTISHYITSSSIPSRLKHTAVHNIFDFRIIGNQIFIGMITLRHKAKQVKLDQTCFRFSKSAFRHLFRHLFARSLLISCQDIPPLVEDLNNAGIRFVYFSEENEIKSQVRHHKTS